LIFLEIGPQLFPRLDDVLGNDPDITDDTDKIRISVPTGNYMDVEVILDARSGRPAQIHSDIEAIGADAFLEGLDGVNDKIEDLRFLGRRQILHTAEVTVGNNHEMTAGVWIAVHHDEGMPARKEPEINAHAIYHIGAEDTLFRFISANVAHSPGGTDGFHNVGQITMTALKNTSTIWIWALTFSRAIG